MVEITFGHNDVKKLLYENQTVILRMKSMQIGLFLDDANISKFSFIDNEGTTHFPENRKKYHLSPCKAYFTHTSTY